MKFSEMLAEYLELREDAKQPESDWISIDDAARNVNRRHERMQELSDAMDALCLPSPTGQP